MTQHYAFIGLGQLGRHLASSLLRAGFRLTIHDLDRQSAESLIAAGAQWAASPGTTLTDADAVITCLPSPAAVDSVLVGPDGVFSALAPGTTWIEMSTNDREEILRLAAIGQDRGISTLEAPVTGGVHRAEAGDITILVGGSEDVYHQHLPALRAMGGEVFHMGRLGNASVIKVITNMLAFVHLIAAGEALMLANKSGLDLGKSFEAIRASSGNSFVHETECQVILNGSYNIGFTMDLACKDLSFARRYGEALGVPLDLASLVGETFERARDAGDAWSPMVVKLLEDAVGSELRAPGFPEVLRAARRTDAQRGI